MPIKVVNKGAVATPGPVSDIPVGVPFHLNSPAGKMLLKSMDEWTPLGNVLKNPNFQVSQAKAKIHIKHKNTGVEKHEDKKLFEVTSPMPMCNVGVQYNHTKNLGNYESVRIGVSVNIPCMVGELDENFEFAKKWADDKLAMLIKEVDDAVNGGGEKGEV